MPRAASKPVAGEGAPALDLRAEPLPVAFGLTKGDHLTEQDVADDRRRERSTTSDTLSVNTGTFCLAHPSKGATQWPGLELGSTTERWGPLQAEPESDNMIYGYAGAIMPRSVSVTELARNFARYINRVAFHGERFVLTRGHRPIAELGPVPEGKRLGELGDLLASLPHLSDADAANFAADVSLGRAELRGAALPDPWQS